MSTSRWAAGFTLLEVLVALVIFALVFGVLAQIFQTGLRQSRVAEASSAAVLFARSQLARVGVELPLVAGTYEGESADGLRWRTVIALAELPDQTPDDELAMVPYLVEVSVTWGDGPSEQVSLTTLRLGALGQ
jgi:general secretion pathway protein I